MSNVPLFFIAIIAKYRGDRNILLLCNILFLGTKCYLSDIVDKKMVLLAYKMCTSQECKRNT